MSRKPSLVSAVLFRFGFTLCCHCLSSASFRQLREPLQTHSSPCLHSVETSVWSAGVRRPIGWTRPKVACTNRVSDAE
ncbi:hypothetical protein AOLI_G00249330 [Acnodon oligacanthus]